MISYSIPGYHGTQQGSVDELTEQFNGEMLFKIPEDVFLDYIEPLEGLNPLY